MIPRTKIPLPNRIGRPSKIDQPKNTEPKKKIAPAMKNQPPINLPVINPEEGIDGQKNRKYSGE
jgi:hypothetical protein